MIRPMRALALAAGVFLIVIVLWDAFESIVLPRRASFRLRLTRLFYRTTWPPFAAAGRRMRPGNPREAFLSVFGPLSLIFLLALWAVSLIFSFALIEWGLGSHISAPAGLSGFSADLYESGTTFFTLGLGDVTPTSTTARVLTTLEAGMGFAFLALVISYLPILAQAFSRREVSIALLDARAGSPPTAAELLRRHSMEGGGDVLAKLLGEWERWSAEVLESHLSYPVLAFYRSQHDNQSWVAALTVVLDTCALVISSGQGPLVRPARLTFAMARHAVADLTSVLGQTPLSSAPDRLPLEELARLRRALAAAGVPITEEGKAEEHLANLRRLYEPYAQALARLLIMPMPLWLPPQGAKDNWETTA